eukprot:1074319-Pelagomonas_calceolata.AAC.4
MPHLLGGHPHRGRSAAGVNKGVLFCLFVTSVVRGPGQGKSTVPGLLPCCMLLQCSKSLKLPSFCVHCITVLKSLKHLLFGQHCHSASCDFMPTSWRPWPVGQTLGTDQDKIKVDLPLLIDCTFCAATGMIAYGAVIGKATPTQLMWIMVALLDEWSVQCAIGLLPNTSAVPCPSICHAVLCAGQVPAFALNQYLVIEQLHILDMGGSNVIHLFGKPVWCAHALGRERLISFSNISSSGRPTCASRGMLAHSVSALSNVVCSVSLVFHVKPCTDCCHIKP